MHRLAVLLVAVVVACSSRGADAPPAPPASQPPSAAAAPAFDAAPVSWRGPNMYTLVDGPVTVGAALLVPGSPWEEDTAGARALVTSPAGSTVSVTLERGAAAPDPVRAERAYRQEYPLPIATGEWRVVCDVALAPADAALFDELVDECAGLRIEVEPDDRVRWALEVSPAKVTMAKRSTVTVRYSVSNRSPDPVDARAYSLTWSVDGVASMGLAMGFGNGGYSSEWHHLASGKTLSDEREGIHIADAPGTYVISVEHLGHELARATLRVTP